MDKNTVIEETLPLIENLQITPPIPPTERDRFTPMVWDLDDKNRIKKLQGVIIDGDGDGLVRTRDLECTPKSFADIADFILKGGTCYIPCSKKFLDIFTKRLSNLDKRELARTRELTTGGYHIKISKGCLLIRQGNKWGRVYSFWTALPKSVVRLLDEYDANPLSLTDFFKVFVLVMTAALKEDLSLSVLHSSASVISTYLLGCRAKLMFGKLNSIPFEVLEYAHQCYKGGRFEGSINHSKEYDYWDTIASHPSIIRTLLPCDSKHMEWRMVKDVPKEYLKRQLEEEAFYAFLTCYVVPTETYKLSPLILRFPTVFGDRLAGFLGPQVVHLTLPEYLLLVTRGLASVDILDGCLGVPFDTQRRLEGPIEKIYGLKKHPVLGRLLSSASQAFAGKMGSMWTETIDEWTLDLHLQEKTVTRTSPLFGIIYASHVNGAQRAYITEDALRCHANFIRADGFGCPVGTIVGREGIEMGNLKLKESGLQSNPDDMLWEGPGSTHLLDAITQEDPDSTAYTEIRKIVRSLRGEYSRGKTLSHVGQVDIIIERRRLGSRKRIPENAPNTGNFLGEGITHSPPKGNLDLELLKLQGGGYDYD